MNLDITLLSRSLLVAALLAVSPAASLAAQDGGPGTGGLVRLAQERQALASPYRVLVIGAHPDDEDNHLMAILSRGWGVETGYLSLTRGEGGQNLIGNELGAALGVVRSSELVAAREVDGGRQFFTRAFDFGYTRSVEETWRFWPRDSLLKDVVRVIRRFRPHVIVSVFSGTPRDGHGQHQASGMLALDGFHAAGDAGRFPELAREEQLEPWSPAKLYRDYGVQEGITLDGGVLDPATGHSLRQLGQRSRSQHRSQDMGQLEEPGPASVMIGLEAMAPGIDAGPMDSLFHGVAVDEDPYDEQHAARMKVIEAGVVLDAYVEDDEVVAGQQLLVHVRVWDPRGTLSRWGVRPRLGEWLGITNLARNCSGDLGASGRYLDCAYPARVWEDAAPSQPAYLTSPASGALYSMDMQVAQRGMPFEPERSILFDLQFGESDVTTIEVPVTARFLDQGLGEIRRPVTIVPRVMVSVTPGSMLWPADLRTRRFTVSLEHAARDTTSGVVRLAVPPGWTVDPPRPVTFSREGERRTVEFAVTPPAGVREGTVTFRAEMIAGADTFATSAERIDYPHIRPRILFSPAEVQATVAPVRFVAQQRIGYIRGAADVIPEALEAAGVAFRLLRAEDLEGAALDSLDVIVVGPRAYEIDDALRRAHPRLLRFAERGGTLIVQYQQYQYIQGGFAPLAMTIARPHDRVTDETAPIRFLDPAHRLGTTPNRITDADFDGWVQERGLYFAHDWDAAWTPLLELQDPGMPPQRGALLVGRLGEGTVVYTGIAFFRQLPAAVPGAWRLFANLLAIGGEG